MKKVAVVARREIKKLAEAKRAVVVNEQWMNGSTNMNFTGIQSFVVNALSFMTVGTADYQFLGNEIIDPLLVFKGAVRVDWGGFINATPNVVPTVTILITLFAANDDTAIVAPRSTTAAEDTAIWIRYPDNSVMGTMNTQNVTVLKRKKIVLRPTSGTVLSSNFPQEVRSFKLVKRLRGKKEFETSTSNPGSGQPTTLTILKGWNYYWHISKVHSSGFPGSVVNQPVQIYADRWVYYRDP